MTTKDFITFVVKPRLDDCINLLEGEKDVEYSRNNDKFYNFKRTGQIRNISTITALDGMFNKHLVSVIDMIDDAKAGILPSQKLINDKITDTINYLLLFEGIVNEEKSEKGK
jgi:hypothetical protein